MLIHSSCKIKTGEEVKALTLDYIGPDAFYPETASLFAGLEKITVQKSDLDGSVYNSSQLALVCHSFASRGAVVLLLMEQGKDVLVLPPLGNGTQEFDAIQKTCNRLDRRLGMLNPFSHLDSVRKLKEQMHGWEPGTVTSAEVRINPGYTLPLVPPVDGNLGAGILLVMLVNELVSSWPDSVEPAGSTATGFVFNHEKMQLTYLEDPGTEGWQVKLDTRNGLFVLDHEGRLRSEQADLVKTSRHAMAGGLQASAADFIESVRSWKECESNPVQAMMQIRLDQKIGQALASGERIYMEGYHEKV